MPELTEQMYCSEQICIPPSFPYLLRQFAKAAIRSQPTDLLKWSTAYFRCLSLNIPPPIKPRLEYPIPRDHCGVTPGWLKALLYQLQNNQTVSFKILWDRWTGSCMQHNTLIQILCLGGFDDPGAIPWLRFIGLCAAHLTDDLTHTMILICEILTEEPEGGSAMITLETFTDLYRFLANIDASRPQVLKNLYFTDSLLSLWRETVEKDEGPKEAKEEVISEEESEKTQVSEESEEKEVKVADSKEIISCPSIPADDDYSMDYYVDLKEEEEGEQEQEQEAEEEAGEQAGQEAGEQKESDTSAGKESEEQLDQEEAGEEGDAEKKASEEGDKTSVKEGEEGEVLAEAEGEVPTEETLIVTDAELLDAAPYESVDTIQEEPRRIEPETPEQRMLREDLDRLKALQQELPGEADDEVEKFKCQLIAEVPLTKSQEDAIVHFTVEEAGKGSEEGESEEGMGGIEEEGGKVYEDIFVDAIPGIGPPVPIQLVNAVCEYMKSVSSIQHGMVMPRNIRHYNCPPLEVLEY